MGSCLTQSMKMGRSQQLNACLLIQTNVKPCAAMLVVKLNAGVGQPRPNNCEIIIVPF